MSWANKAHKRIEKQKEDEKFNQDARNAMDLFFSHNGRLSSQA